MGLRRLLREAWRSVVSARAMSSLVVVVVAACMATIDLTSGQTQATVARVAGQLDAAQFRVTVLTSDVAVPMRRDALEAYAARSDVETVVAVGAAVDVKPTVLGGGGAPFPVRAGMVAGGPSALFVVPSGGLEGLYVPASGSDAAILSYSDARGASLAVAGTFYADADALPQFAGTGVVLTHADVVDARALFIVSPTPAQAERQRVDAVSLWGDAEVSVTSSADYQAVSRSVRSELARFSRYLVFGVAGGGAVLIGAIVVAWAFLRQRDLGRRRALGATRGAIAMIATAQVTMLAVLGVATGALSMAVAAVLGVASTPPATYQLATAWILVLAASIAAGIPSALLSLRDPVRVLRQP